MTKLLRVSKNSLNWSPLSGATWALLESMGAWHLALQLKRCCQTVQMGSLPSACTTLSAPSLPVFLNGPPLQIPMYLYSKPQLTAIVHVSRLLIKRLQRWDSRRCGSSILAWATHPLDCHCYLTNPQIHRAQQFERQQLMNYQSDLMCATLRG